MSLMSLSIFVVVLISMILISNNNKNNREKNNNNVYDEENKQSKKGVNIAKFILMSIPVFIVIYMVLTFIAMIVIYSFSYADSGAWAYGIVIGFTFSLIATPIVVYKLMKE